MVVLVYLLLEAVVTRRGTATPTTGATTGDEQLPPVTMVDGVAVMVCLLVVKVGLSGVTGTMEPGPTTGVTGASGTRRGLHRRLRLRLHPGPLPGLPGACGTRTARRRSWGTWYQDRTEEAGAEQGRGRLPREHLPHEPRGHAGGGWGQ